MTHKSGDWLAHADRMTWQTRQLQQLDHQQGQRRLQYSKLKHIARQPARAFGEAETSTELHSQSCTQATLDLGQRDPEDCQTGHSHPANTQCRSKCTRSSQLLRLAPPENFISCVLRAAAAGDTTQLIRQLALLLLVATHTSRPATHAWTSARCTGSSLAISQSLCRIPTRMILNCVSQCW